MPYFDPLKASRYAAQFAAHPNSAYPMAHPDCTNFVSQCLREGGWTMQEAKGTSRWSYKVWYCDPDQWYGQPFSRSWSDAVTFAHYAELSPRATKVYAATGLQAALPMLAVGDVLQYGATAVFETFEHTAIVTTVSPAAPQHGTMHQHGSAPMRELGYVAQHYATRVWTVWRPARMYVD